ncbi:DUF1963 domain-containing protein [Moraxellaceae bacterium AER2_44_116]|nr:DUF1963 domain-containing protein [Moraxellaceae bacterium]TQC97489.1 DUF1963 domain-containing protein [Moraxellaceae bacterium AER2_44_116]
MSDLTTSYIHDLKQKMASHGREACYIKWQKQDQPSPYTSRLGGKIAWASHTLYPQCQQQPLVFLAQINFAEMPPIKGYPTQGLLQFFIADDDLMGCSFEGGAPVQHENSSYRVVYWHDVSQLDVLLEPVVAEYSPHRPEQAYVMQFEWAKQPLSIHDVAFEQIMGQSIYHLPMPEGVDDEDVYDELQEAALWTSQVGGYAEFTQEDPRAVDSPLVLLLQLSSDDKAEMMWGDSGIANFFIDPDDLAKSDFSRVLYNWDCC